MIFSYPNDMDVEMIPLCEILNSFKGITTMYSCCGHESKSGNSNFYFAAACTTEGIETLFKIFEWSKFDYNISDKNNDEINKKFINNLEKATKTCRIFIDVHYKTKTLVQSEGNPKEWIEKELPTLTNKEISEYCTKAMKVLAEQEPKAYFDYLYVANEMNKIRESLPRMCNYKYINDKEK